MNTGVFMSNPVQHNTALREAEGVTQGQSRGPPYSCAIIACTTQANRIPHQEAQTAMKIWLFGWTVPATGAGGAGPVPMHVRGIPVVAACTTVRKV